MKILASKIELLMLALLGLLMSCSTLLVTDPASAVAVPATPEVVDTEVARAPVVPTMEPATTTPEPLPDFAAIHNVSEKKQAFFEFMLPKIRTSNDRIREIRRELMGYREVLLHVGNLDAEAERRIQALSRRYRVATDDSLASQIAQLLIRADVVPESLVLAQAANESGWGTSRFARKANNMFGVWCFTPGCGITPLSRDEGLTHEVASYDSVQASVDAYVHTINTNGAYRDLRAIRAEARTIEQHICGVELAEGLEKYSARGEDYVREIQQMIRVNNLQRYNRAVQPQAV